VRPGSSGEGPDSAEITVPFVLELLSGHRDTTHVWGEFVESPLPGGALIRDILVYPGGRTSVHRHSSQAELDIVTGGAVEILLGPHPDELDRRLVRAGEIFHVPAGMFHAVRFAESDQTGGQPCARFFEFVVGHPTTQDIHRHEPAVPGSPPRFEVDPFDHGLIREGWPL
jgi:quercetin dioxygenase-like cupin family protein